MLTLRLFAVFGIAIALAQESVPGSSPPASSSVEHFRAGELLFDQHNFQSSAIEFGKALQGQPIFLWVRVWSHIDLGRIFALTGQGERAAAEYRRAVATQDDTDGAQAYVAGLLAATGRADAVRHVAARSAIFDPNKVVEVTALYSPEARLAGLEGYVTVLATLNGDRDLTNLQLVGSPLGLGLDEAVIAAADKWVLDPEHRSQLPANGSLVLHSNFFVKGSSRWHLLRASFSPEANVSRPLFVHTSYPLGRGVSPAGMDAASMIRALGPHREAVVTLAFDVAATGRPLNVAVVKATEPIWGSEAAAFVRKWAFAPGKQERKAVSVSCTIDLAWGATQFTSESLDLAEAAFEGIGAPRN